MDLIDRLAQYLALTDDECLVWIAGRNPHGYGNIDINRRTRGAHRVVYEAVVGPIPPGQDLGHTCHDLDLSCAGGSACRHRACCHPEHLRPMTPQENAAAGRNALRGLRSAACSMGHIRTPENTYVWPDGRRVQCRDCRRVWAAGARARRAA
jgi:hypothetical protein